MTNRYAAVAKFIGARVNVVVTDTRPSFASDITVTSWTTVGNIDGSNHFMRDDGGWTFLPHGDREFCDAVYAAARPLFAEGRTVSPRAQALADCRRMILTQVSHVRRCTSESQRAHCLGYLRDYLKSRRYWLATA